MNEEIFIKYLNAQIYNKDREAAYIRYLTWEQPSIIMIRDRNSTGGKDK